MELTFEQKLKAAVWMVGNMDTEADKAAWWETFGSVFNEVKKDGSVQSYADTLAGTAPVKA